MTTRPTPTPLPVKIVAGAVIAIDALLLLAAAFYAVDTWITLSQPGDHSLVSLGYYVAALFAAAALPSLVLAIVALRTRGAAATACAALSVVVLVLVLASPVVLAVGLGWSQTS